MLCVVRALALADAPEAAAVIHDAFRLQSVPTDPPSAALGETAATIAARIASGGGACALPDGGLAGVVLWAEQDGGLYLSRLAVRPAWRRRGIARRLIAAAEAAARHHGLPRLHLGARLVLADNRQLFTACGFVETGLATHSGYAAPTSVVMEKQLAALQE